MSRPPGGHAVRRFFVELDLVSSVLVILDFCGYVCYNSYRTDRTRTRTRQAMARSKIVTHVAAPLSLTAIIALCAVLGMLISGILRREIQDVGFFGGMLLGVVAIVYLIEPLAKSGFIE